MYHDFNWWLEWYISGIPIMICGSLSTQLPHYREPISHVRCLKITHHIKLYTINMQSKAIKRFKNYKDTVAILFAAPCTICLSMRYDGVRSSRVMCVTWFMSRDCHVVFVRRIKAFDLVNLFLLLLWGEHSEISFVFYSLLSSQGHFNYFVSLSCALNISNIFVQEAIFLHQEILRLIFRDFLCFLFSIRS